MKVLVIRFSSIGDIVLTSPVVRSLAQSPQVNEVHFLSKSNFQQLLLPNPYLTQVHSLMDSFQETIDELRAENFDHIIDLHNNLRSWRVSRALNCQSSRVDKYNWSKFKMTRFQARGIVVPHIVDRYGATLKDLGIELDGEGLDFFIPHEAEVSAAAELQQSAIGAQMDRTLAVVLGASYRTKRWLTSNFIHLLNSLSRPALLIGGPDMEEEAAELEKGLTIPFFNAVGKYGIWESAAMMKQCESVLAHDTGFMHIAAAFKMKIYSIWGNTVPEFGMTPYHTPYEVLEVPNLSCRPCSKLGFDVCPQRHFRCMKDLSPERVLERIEESDAPTTGT